MNKINLLIATFFAIIVIGCTSTPTMDNFTYTYSMENVNNFKVEFQLNSDSTFKITQFNFFFDNFENTRKPISTEGTLNSEEFSIFKKLLQQSNIEDMEDSYGFDDKTATESDIMYMIELKQNEKSKFVSINANDVITFSKKFTELIAYTNTIISEKLKVV